MFFLGTNVSGLRPESSSSPSNSLDCTKQMQVSTKTLLFNIIIAMKLNYNKREAKVQTLFMVWLLIGLGLILVAGRGETWQITEKTTEHLVMKYTGFAMS